MLLSACQTTPDPTCTPTEQAILEPDRTTVAIGFVEAAYGLGIEPAGCHGVISRNKLQRWHQSKAVTLVVRGEPPGPLYHRIDRSLQDLYRQAGQTLRLDFGTNQLLSVTITDDPLPDAVCNTYYQKADAGLLKTVHIVAPRVLLNGDNKECLLHEGMHSLGFSGHPYKLDSVLNYARNQSSLTDIDRQLIDVLYHYALSDEATPDEARDFAYKQFSGFRE